jgi:hypothetical protein
VSNKAISLALALAAQPQASHLYWRGALGGGLIGGALFLGIAGALSIGLPTRSTPWRRDPVGWMHLRTRPYAVGIAIIFFVIAAVGAAVHWL